MTDHRKPPDRTDAPRPWPAHDDPVGIWDVPRPAHQPGALGLAVDGWDEKAKPEVVRWVRKDDER